MSEKCKKCGATPCYVSFMGNVECSNPGCEFYSKDLFPAKASKPAASTKKKEDEDEDEDEDDHGVNKDAAIAKDNKTDGQIVMSFDWLTHHNDFGDC